MNAKAKSLFSAGNRRKKIAIFAIAILLVLAGSLGVGGVLMHASNTGEAQSANVAEKNNGTIDIPGFEKLSFSAGLKKQSVHFLNPEENACYFQISLVMEDGTVLWTSDMLEPGEEINELQLNKELDKGTYSATVKYDCFSLEDQLPLNGAEIKVTINVV